MIKKSKRLLSLLLAFIMILTAIPVTGMLAYGDTPSTPRTAAAAVSNHAGSSTNDRYGGTSINIVSGDRGSADYSYGLWTYNISAITSRASIDTAKLAVQIAPDNAAALDMYIDFYIVPTDKMTHEYAAPTVLSKYETNDVQYHVSDLGTPSSTNNPTTKVKNALGLNSTNLIGSYKHAGGNKNTFTSHEYNFAKQLKAALSAGQTTLKVIGLPRSVYIGTDAWSDIHVQHPTITVTTKVLPTVDFNLTKSSHAAHANRNADLRLNSGYVNVTADNNDSTYGTSYSYGVWEYDISKITEGVSEVTSAVINSTISFGAGPHNDQHIKFYLIPYEKFSSDLAASASDSSTGSEVYTHNSAPFNLTHSTGYNMVVDELGLNDSNLIGDVTLDATSKTLNVDIASMIQKEIRARHTEIRVIALYSTNVETGYWSDANVNNPTFTVSGIALPDINKYNDKNAVTGRISVDNVIYTNDINDYRNYGTVISETEDYMTDYTILGDYTLSSIECMETDAVLDTRKAYGKRIIIGDLNGDKFRVAGDKNVTATLKFTFDDDAVEYHRVAVKSTPVEAHVPIRASKGTDAFGHWESGLTTIMRGSYGSGGSGNWAMLKTYPKEGSTALGNPDANWDSNDKNAGHYGVNYGTSGCTAMSDPATATYYFDISNKNLANGKLLNAQNYYTINIDIIRTRFEFYQAHDWTTLNKDQYPTTGTLNIPYLNNSDANGTTTTVTYYNNASVSKTSRAVTGNDADTGCNLRFGLIPTEGCWAVPRFNLEVFYFNKSEFRNRYNQLINYNLNESTYTASSYADYINALLDAEAYLSNFEITTNTDSAILSKLNDAYNSLEERGDVTLVTEKAKEGAEECAKNLYTPSSVENFEAVSEACVSSVSNLTEDEARDISTAQVDEMVNTIQEAIDALDPFADFTSLDEAYTRADTLLASLAQRENALYSQQSVEALISAENEADRYVSLNESERKDIGQNQYQSVLENMAASINTQYDSLNANALELSAFNAMIDLVNKYDKDVYTDEALRLAEEKIATIYRTISYKSTEIYVLNVSTQNEIDEVIETVLNTLNGSRVTYTVTVPSGVTVTSSGAEVTEIEAGKYSVAYGTELTFSVPEEETAWYMSYTSVTASRTRQYQAHGASYTMKILGDVEIAPVSRSEQTPYKVELVRAYDKDESNLKIQCIDYVSSSYTLPQSVPVPYYDFAGYRFDYKVWNPGQSISITGDSRIVADYTHSANPYSIKITNTSGEYIINERAYPYNARISVEDANAFAWIELIKDNTNTNYRLFGYGTSLDFFLCESTTIKAVASADELRSYGIDPALGYSNIRQDTREYIGTTSIFIGQYVLPENATLKECGILLSTSISYNGDETLITENSGQKSFYRLKSTKSIETNQYTVRVSNLSDARTVYYRSYLIYEKDGKLYTAYSPVKNTRS